MMLEASFAKVSELLDGLTQSNARTIDCRFNSRITRDPAVFKCCQIVCTERNDSPTVIYVEDCTFGAVRYRGCRRPETPYLLR